MENFVIDFTSTGTLAIAVFGVVFCLMQTKHSAVSRSFAAFLASVALNNLPDAFRGLLEALPDTYEVIADFAVWPSSFFLAPLFWIYVFTLTSPEQRHPARLKRHFVMPGLAVVVGVLVLASPASVREALAADAPEVFTGWTLALAMSLVLLQLAVFPQIAFYLYLIIRRMIRFRLQLRDVYASTEQHELRWIYVIGGLAVLFWLAQAVLLVVVFDPDNAKTQASSLIAASLAGFALVAATTLWGLRQPPPLVPEPDPPAPSAPEQAETKTQPTGKYEKSALSPEASQRLGRKLRAAMEVDHLYRDPNLSLWILARHIGASSNYISQALNEEIGESFFDFVNRHRVAEATTLLTSTDSSILTITYDVGFNARSSFYNAFKRMTGQTPSSYRKKMSQRDGLDDIKA